MPMLSAVMKSSEEGGEGEGATGKAGSQSACLFNHRECYNIKSNKAYYNLLFIISTSVPVFILLKL